jgi:hypothetical protein
MYHRQQVYGRCIFILFTCLIHRVFFLSFYGGLATTLTFRFTDRKLKSALRFYFEPGGECSPRSKFHISEVIGVLCTPFVL